MDIIKNPDLYIVFNGLISGGAFLSFILALCTLVLKYPRRSSYYLTLLCFIVGVTQLYAWFNLNTKIFTPLWMNYPFVGLNFFFGPGVYYLYKATGDENFNPSRKVQWTFLPGLIALILIPLVNMVAPEAMPTNPRQYFDTGKPSFIDVLFSLAMLHNSGYYIKLFLVTRPLLKTNPELKDNGGLTAFLMFFGVITFINLYGIFAYISRDIRHFFADSCIISLLMVGFLMFALRYPQYFLKMEPSRQQ